MDGNVGNGKSIVLDTVIPLLGIGSMRVCCVVGKRGSNVGGGGGSFLDGCFGFVGLNGTTKLGRFGLVGKLEIGEPVGILGSDGGIVFTGNLDGAFVCTTSMILGNWEIPGGTRGSTFVPVLGTTGNRFDVGTMTMGERVVVLNLGLGMFCTTEFVFTVTEVSVGIGGNNGMSDGTIGNKILGNREIPGGTRDATVVPVLGTTGNRFDVGTMTMGERVVVVVLNLGLGMFCTTEFVFTVTEVSVGIGGNNSMSDGTIGNSLDVGTKTMGERVVVLNVGLGMFCTTKFVFTVTEVSVGIDGNNGMSDGGKEGTGVPKEGNVGFDGLETKRSGMRGGDLTDGVTGVGIVMTLDGRGGIVSLIGGFVLSIGRLGDHTGGIFGNSSNRGGSENK